MSNKFTLLHLNCVTFFLSMHCMAMLSYPCMEEKSCVCTVPASRSIVSLCYFTMLELTVELSKQKRKSKHPQSTVAFYFTSFQMNEWLFTRGEKIWGCLKDMKEKWNAKKEKKRTLLVVKFVQVEERKLCNIYLPLQRNSSGNNPCNWFLIQEKMRTN